MKKIIVSEEACIGCGACVAVDPEHFAFNDEGLSHPISQTNLESTELTDAMESCPTSAIILSKGDTSSCTCGDECHCTKEDNCGCIEYNCECSPDCTCDDCHCEEE